MEHFIDGLKSEIRKFMMCVGIPNTIDQCLKMAKNVEVANSFDEHDSNHDHEIDRCKNFNKQRFTAAENVNNFHRNNFHGLCHVYNNERVPSPQKEIDKLKLCNKRPFPQHVDENRYFNEPNSDHNSQMPPAKYYHHAGETKIDTTSSICKNHKKIEQALENDGLDNDRLENVSNVVNKAVDESETKISKVFEFVENCSSEKFPSKLEIVENGCQNLDANSENPQNYLISENLKSQKFQSKSETIDNEPNRLEKSGTVQNDQQQLEQAAEKINKESGKTENQTPNVTAASNQNQQLVTSKVENRKIVELSKSKVENDQELFCQPIIKRGKYTTSNNVQVIHNWKTPNKINPKIDMTKITKFLSTRQPQFDVTRFSNEKWTKIQHRHNDKFYYRNNFPYNDDIASRAPVANRFQTPRQRDQGRQSCQRRADRETTADDGRTSGGGGGM